MAISWNGTNAAPIPIGGAARLWADVAGADAVMAVVGASSVLDPDELPLDSVGIPLDLLGARGWHGVVWGAHGATQVSWFARSSGGAWAPGPVNPITLPFAIVPAFPVPISWVVDRIQDYAAGIPPLRSRVFAVSTSYPRDVSAWPMGSAQVDDISPSSAVISNLLATHGRRVGSAYTVTFSVVCWCSTPEDRRILTPWLAGALEAVKLCAQAHPDLYEPHFSVSESEDFQTMGVPAFLSTARLSATVFSALQVPDSAFTGPVTIT